MRHRPSKSIFAVTIIELVMLVAIIALLAMIAAPNLERAQAWAKVTRAAADMHTLDTAITVYSMDHNGYPGAHTEPSISELAAVTTPIAYITSVPKDIFGRTPEGESMPYEYVVFRFHTGLPLYLDEGAEPWRGGNPVALCYLMEAPVGFTSFGYDWFVFSRGPDQDEEYNYVGNHPRCVFDKIYDPTNGTVSSGDIFRVSNHDLLY